MYGSGKHQILVEVGRHQSQIVSILKTPHTSFSVHNPSAACTHVDGASALQVVCAGVWHNAVLCALCWLCALLLPLLLMPMYTTGTGAVVRYGLGYLMHSVT